MRRVLFHGRAARAGAAFLLLLAASAADAAKITTYAIPTQASGAQGIALGPDGRIWFTEALAHQVGSLSTDGVFDYEVPTTLPPHGIAPVPGNALAFTGYLSGTYGYVGVDGGKAEYQAAGSAPWALVFAPDGRLWMTDLDSTSVTAIHYFPNSPNTAAVSLSYPASAITVGPDGRIWMTAGDQQHAELAACPLAGGPCTEYHLPTFTSLGQITGGADGNLWFTEGSTNRIGRMTPAGVLTEFPIPTPASTPTGICAGPDGNVWFTEKATGKVGRITKAGTIREYAVAGAVSLTAMTAGPDGTVWFLDEGANRVGRVRIFVPGDVDDDGDVTVADVFYLINYLFAGGPAPK